MTLEGLVRVGAGRLGGVLRRIFAIAFVFAFPFEGPFATTFAFARVLVLGCMMGWEGAWACMGVLVCAAVVAAGGKVTSPSTSMLYGWENVC